MTKQARALSVAIVIPAYNEEDQIEACLQAIADQSEPPQEVIVVDNASTDNTVKIAKSFKFVKIFHEKRRGVRFARDLGINTAKSDIIGRIDADSRLTADWCKNVRRLFQDKTIDAASGPCYYHDMPIKAIGLVLDRTIRGVLFKLDESPMLFGSNMAIRRSVWEKVRRNLCTEGEFFEDTDITIHLRLGGYKITFDKNLIAGVSSRRLEDDPKTFVRNMELHTRTFEMHGLKSPAALAGKYVYLGTYSPLKLLRKAYDPELERLSLTKALTNKSHPRPSSST